MKKVVLLSLAALMVGGCSREQVRSFPAPVSVSPFKEINVDFAHRWNESSHPFTGAAVLDVDGDNQYEIFVGGGEGQDDALLRFQQGMLEDVISETGLSSKVATYGATAFDMDSDGATDLLVARNDGVHLYLNKGGSFTHRLVPVTLDNDAVPFSVAVTDIERDGDPDLYISAFVAISAFRSAVFNDASHAKKNVLLVNDGNLSFKDITDTAGVAGKQNTFFSTFVDLDNDGWQDLVVAQNTGEIEIYRNNKDRTFKPVDYHSGYGFWMGLAVGDVDNDGDQDLFFSNLGNSIPAFLTTGDLQDDQRHAPEWLMLRNDGDFTFRDVTEDYQLTNYGFAWGAVFEDLDYDGWLDLLVAQNYIKWPIHQWSRLANKAFLQAQAREHRSFFHSSDLGLDNHYFGQSPVIADLDGDGRQDVLWLNMDGPVRAFLNTSKQPFITLTLPETAAALGTTVRLTSAKAQSYTRESITSAGLLTDQTPDLSFALPEAGPVAVDIVWPQGVTQRITDLEKNRRHYLAVPAAQGPQ